MRLDFSRPRLLVDAARFAARRLAAAESAAPAARLIEEEAALEAERRSRAPAYRPSRHVLALARLIAAGTGPEAEPA